MLGPAEVVNAHRVWHLQVAAAGDIDVHQGTVAAPVLGGGVGMHHLRRFAVGRQAR